MALIGKAQQTFRQAIKDDYRPLGRDEEIVVQKMADIMWTITKTVHLSFVMGSVESLEELCDREEALHAQLQAAEARLESLQSRRKQAWLI